MEVRLRRVSAMYERVNSPDNVFHTIEVESTRFKLHLGDRVFPQTVIGRDFKSGKIVRSDCWGYVTWIGLNPLNHSLLVSMSGSEELRWSYLPKNDGVIDGVKT